MSVCNLLPHMITEHPRLGAAKAGKGAILQASAFAPAGGSAPTSLECAINTLNLICICQRTTAALCELDFTMFRNSATAL